MVGRSVYRRLTSLAVSDISLLEHVTESEDLILTLGAVVYDKCMN